MTSCRRRLVALVCFLSFVCLSVPREGRACSICQCGDSLYSPSGASAQPVGAWSFYAENRHTWKSSATLPEEADWNPADREKSYDREQRAPWLRFAVRMPLGDGALHGHQHEGFVLLAGVGVPF